MCKKTQKENKKAARHPDGRGGLWCVFAVDLRVFLLPTFPTICMYYFFNGEGFATHQQQSLCLMLKIKNNNNKKNNTRIAS